MRYSKHMDVNFWATTLEMIGSVLIGWAALRVHHRVMGKHKIDQRVVRVMRVEQRFGSLGIMLVVLGYPRHVAV
jgi:uncharacterized membrane protein